MKNKQGEGLQKYMLQCKEEGIQHCTNTHTTTPKETAKVIKEMQEYVDMRRGLHK